MDVNNIDHIAIRDHSYVAGNSDKPEVGVFVQTNTQRKPLNDSKLEVGQSVWMKWVGGPIVAKSNILSWHTGVFENGNINDLRELCIGTNLFGLSNYWKTISDKKFGYYVVILLTSEEWLNDPIFVNARAYGSSWIYLDSIDKKQLWLTHDQKEVEKDKEKSKGRSIPQGLRFQVLRRDNFTCQYCGAKAPEVILHIDHKVPWKIVKKHELVNLVTACSSCNLGKSDKLL